MRLLLLLLVASSACRAGTPGIATGAVPAVVTDNAARAAIGRTATVTGRVAQVKTRAHHGFAYLNFGGRFPDQTFSVLIPDSVAAGFGDLARYEGHEVRVTGLVWLQDERWPAITLTDPASMELLR